jgi:ferredoxin--NADP+ reductase
VFEPGQFATLGLPAPDPPAGALTPARPRRGPRLVRRAYSIASAPVNGQALEFFVAKVEDGKLTPRLWDLPVGGRLFMDERLRGEFTLAAIPPAADLLMVATGTGVAPFVSMVRAYRGKGRWRRCTLIYSARLAADLGYHEQLQAVEREDQSFRYLPTVTREPADSPWRGARGRPQALLDPAKAPATLGFALDPARCHVLLCGNPAMIDEVAVLLGPLGFIKDKGNLHFERYW